MVAYLSHKGVPVRDVDWVANVFSVSAEQLDKRYQFAAWSTTAHNKYTDTRIGGNWAVNNPPAYTRYADPRQSSLNHRSSPTTRPAGMGQFYSEQLDDNAHLIHMCFGVKNHRGMLTFFNGMGDLQAAVYARLGRVPLSFLFGQVAGIYTAMRFLPLLLVGVAANFLLNRASSKYYSLKPTMHAYWKRVDFICNTFAVSIGLYQSPAMLNWGKKDHEAEMDPINSAAYGYTKNQHSDLVNQAYAEAPEIFRKRGGIDVYSMVTRSQQLANARRDMLNAKAEQINSREDLIARMVEFEYTMDVPANKLKIQTLDELIEDSHGKVYDKYMSIGGTLFNEDTLEGSTEALSAASTTADGATIINTAGVSNELTATTNADGTMTSNAPSSTATATGAGAFNSVVTDPNNPLAEPTIQQGWMSKLWSSMKVNYHGAYEWISFRVEHTGSISSSFSNSSRESDISSMINGFSSTMAGHRFTFSNGATGIGVFDAAVGTIKNTMLGFMDGLNAAGVISLAGSANVDIPEHWEASSTNWPSEPFKMHLRTIYANKLSRFMALYVPLSMIMAGALPISTGRQQYASPFYCQVISPGRMSCKLGMIENLSIDIGVGNIGFNQMNQPLAFDVSWQVKDMNKTAHAPIDTGASLLNPLRSIFDDDNAFNDYLNVLSAISMADQINPMRKLSRNIAVRLNQWDSFWSVGNMTMGFYDSMLGRGVKHTLTAAAMAGVPGVSIPQLNRSLVP